MQDRNLVILAILDGWGIAKEGPGNAITLAKTPNMSRLQASYPHTSLKAAGEAVGLPREEPGNTETGHLNLGAGRIVYQDLARINMAIADGTFFDDEALNSAIKHANDNNSDLHVMGLVGAGGVHSNIEHLFAIIRLVKQKGIKKQLFIHVFTDGRDSPPTASLSYIQQLKEVIEKEGVGKIASIMGRYWSMDRDFRWDRTAKAYFALIKGEGHLVKSCDEAINMSYSQGKTDEFIEPSLISTPEGIPVGLIKENDAVIFCNFRIDRPRQLTKAFVSTDFAKSSMEWGFDPYAVKYEKKHDVHKEPLRPSFKREDKLKNLLFVTMTEYDKSFYDEGVLVAYPPAVVTMPLGRVLSSHSLRQLRTCESEKERFVTFYFNGQQETKFLGEDRIIVPSPKVPTYDQKPEMSAYPMTEKLLQTLRDGTDYSFILINYANVDMVGHTGNIGPAVRACEVVDECIGKIANYVLAFGGTLLITADHGNVEEMINLHTGQIDTEHSTNPVPLIAVSRKFLGKSQILPFGILADVAPTVLALLGIEKPTTMTGRNLLADLIK
jgi:2,3-bisphosphoglycerate-independent phosphoglycerate mutase